jgi:hypothetical protein
LVCSIDCVLADAPAGTEELSCRKIAAQFGKVRSEGQPVGEGNALASSKINFTNAERSKWITSVAAELREDFTSGRLPVGEC